MTEKTDQNEKKAGRPKVGDMLRVRMPDEMLKNLSRRAGKHGLTVSEYVRALVLMDSLNAEYGEEKK